MNYLTKKLFIILYCVFIAFCTVIAIPMVIGRVSWHVSTFLCDVLDAVHKKACK